MAKETNISPVTLEMVAGGEVGAALEREIRKTTLKLQQIAGPMGKAKGSVSLVFTFEVQGSSTSISPVITSKTPKENHESVVFFIGPDGALLTNHPKQLKMWPHDAESR